MSKSANGFWLGTEWERKKITEERARQVDAALDALEAAMNGQTPDVEDAFADIVANTGKLPPHLQAQLDKKEKH